MLVDLALQGGGAHGAFTWGVLDRLLDEDRLQIEGISGTSAGAMNAAVLARRPRGRRARRAPRRRCEDFWRRVSDAARLSPFRRSPLDVHARALDDGYLARVPRLRPRRAPVLALRPQSDGRQPAARDPRRQRRLRRGWRDSPIRLFVTATNVRTGRGRVFRNAELTPDVLLASACLPTLFQAVEIDGEAYWDGGYAGNPTITPLVRECSSSDTVLVQVNPVERAGTPRSARDILNRLNEVSFNATLLKELRMIAVLRQVANPGNCEGARWAGMRIHRIASEAMTDLGYSSKLNAEWDFLCMLRDEGRRCAEEFLAAHEHDIGHRSSFDLDVLLEQV